MNNSLKKNKSKPGIYKIIYNLCLTGIFLSLIIICKFLSRYLKFINGYSVQIQYIPLILGLLYIPLIKYKIILYLLSPVLQLMFGFEGNPIFDYLFTGWSWWIFIFLANKIIRITFWKNLFLIGFCLVVTYLQMWWWNTLSGVLFYEVSWSFSFKYNMAFNLVNLAVVSVFSFWILSFILKFKITNYEFKSPLDWKIKQQEHLSRSIFKKHEPLQN